MWETQKRSENYFDLNSISSPKELVLTNLDAQNNYLFFLPFCYTAVVTFILVTRGPSGQLG